MAKDDPAEFDGMVFQSFPETLSGYQIARLLECPPAEVRELVRSGLPVERVGKMTVHPTLASLRWLTQRGWRDRWR